MRLLIACLAGLVLLAAGLVLGGEMGAFQRAQEDSLSFYTEPDSELAVPPRSVEGQYLALLTCDDALRTRSRRFMPPERRALVAEQCLELGSAILARRTAFRNRR